MSRNHNKSPFTVKDAGHALSRPAEVRRRQRPAQIGAAALVARALASIASLVLVALVAGFAGGMPRQADAAAPDTRVKNEILVKFRDNVSNRLIAQTNAEAGATVISKIDELGVLRLRVPEKALDHLLDAYSRNPKVEFAEPNFIASTTGDPDDPYYISGYQWDLLKVHAPEAWALTEGAPSIDIAILDTGIDVNHPDLAGKVVISANFSGSPTSSDLYGHGTHVAGIAAGGTNNLQGIASLGYNSSLMNVKVMSDDGTGSYASVAKGITWAADNGANVINLSLGGTSSSQTLARAVNYAWKKGVILVAAAGNNGTTDPFYPAYYNNVIAVASSDIFDNLSPYSNRGSWVEVAAPGGNIWSTLPGGNYAYMAGTSMAAPHVAGLAALVLTRFPSASAARNCIIANTDPIVANIGGGRINALKAVTCGP
jgi:thermitase